ncbi:MAG: ATP-binding domain-containing protein, partial [Pseudomonadota bacterium]|nr:ATP-binding domain-containing protein [Pseudomonadota bacterium]
DSVKVMTIHSSKGLEFPIVAIAGIGFMPTKVDTGEEDARLLYVGMTRATERLFMTASRDSTFVQRFARLEEAA